MANRLGNEELNDVLDLMGVDLTDDNREHLDVLLECFDLYTARSENYGQVWKNYGALNNLVRSASKVDRLMETWWHGRPPESAHPAMHKDSLDDALDAVSYLTFFIRSARAGNLTGTPPERPEQPEKPGLRLV